jgi:hypothetical protein
MPENALMMIHRAMCIASGNAGDMLEMASTLEKHDNVIAGIYSARNGKSNKENLDAMEAETWFNGKDALAFGLCDKTSKAVAMSNTYDLTKFNFKNLSAAQSGTKTNEPEPATKSDDSAAKISPSNNADGKPAAAQAGGKPTTNPTNTMPTQDTTAAATPTAPANDFAPVIAAINALGDKLNQPAPGAAPIAASNIVVMDNPAVAKYKTLAPGAVRNAFRVEQHAQLMKHAPTNSNTIDSALIPDYMSDALITIANNKLAMLKSFSLGVGVNPLAPRSTVQVKLASAGSTTLTNATNFEQGGSTLAGQPITVDQYTQPFNLTNAEVNQGIIISNLAQVNADALANKISDVITALFVSGSYSAATAIGAASAMAAAKLSIIYGVAKNFRRKNLLLDGGHLAYLLPTNSQSFKLGEQGAYGFDLISEQNRWTAGETNIAGFVCSPDALAIATGTPLNLPSSEFLSQTTVDLANGLSVVLSSWYSRSSRNIWMSYDVMFGAGVGDNTQGEILVTS